MGTLYLVATPIGNLADITLRALEVLRRADLLLAEDTRRTRVLLAHHGVRAHPRSFHAHNEAARGAFALAELAAGAQVALVSDAGTPLLSDPGEALVARALAAGHAVVPLPGASAPLVALVASGLPASPFSFHGFLPRKPGARKKMLMVLAARPETLVFFEAPRRLAGTLRAMVEAFGETRSACVAREISKVHEEFTRGALFELAAKFADGARGEVTLVVAGAAPKAPEPETLRPRVRAALKAGQRASELARALHQATGVSRRALYQMALEEKVRE